MNGNCRINFLNGIWKTENENFLLYSNWISRNKFLSEIRKFWNKITSKSFILEYDEIPKQERQVEQGERRKKKKLRMKYIFEVTDRFFLSLIISVPFTLITIMLPWKEGDSEVERQRGDREGIGWSHALCHPVAYLTDDTVSMGIFNKEDWWSLPFLSPLYSLEGCVNVMNTNC